MSRQGTITASKLKLAALRTCLVASLTALICFIVVTNDVSAAELRWIEIEKYDGVRDINGLVPLKTFGYRSDGLLQGEFLYATIAVDERLKADPGQPEYVIVLNTVVDLENTWPDLDFSSFEEWGFCTDKKGRCIDYYWLTDTVGPFSMIATSVRHNGTVMTASAHCGESLEELAAAEDPHQAICRPGRMNILVATAVVRLRDFQIRSKSSDPATRRIALHLADYDRKDHYIMFRAAGLIDEASKFLNSH